MKKYIIGLITAFIVIIACKTQKHIINQDVHHKIFTGNTLQDTIQYIQMQVIDKKDQFIGKELNVLLNGMDIKPASYTYGIVPSNIYISNSLSLSFYSEKENRYKIYKKLPDFNLIIKWQSPLPKDSVHAVRLRSGGGWNQDEVNYYGKQIVGDVILGKYNMKQ